MAKKRQKPGDHWHNFGDSSIILGAGMVDGKLTIAFHKGGMPTGVYQYETDEPNLCCEMVYTGSKGGFFHSRISYLPYTKIG